MNRARQLVDFIDNAVDEVKYGDYIRYAWCLYQNMDVSCIALVAAGNILSYHP
ncbi:MAG: hypothetical protein WCP65_00725 [Bacteroidota bacterium]